MDEMTAIESIKEFVQKFNSHELNVFSVPLNRLVRVRFKVTREPEGLCKVKSTALFQKNKVSYVACENIESALVAHYKSHVRNGGFTGATYAADAVAAALGLLALEYGSKTGIGAALSRELERAKEGANKLTSAAALTTMITGFTRAADDSDVIEPPLPETKAGGGIASRPAAQPETEATALCQYVNEPSRNRARAALILAILEELGVEELGGDQYASGRLTRFKNGHTLDTLPDRKLTVQPIRKWSNATLTVSVKHLRSMGEKACIYASDRQAAKSYKDVQIKYMNRGGNALDFTAMKFCHAQPVNIITSLDCRSVLPTSLDLDEATQFYILSVAGLNVVYGGGKRLSYKMREQAIKQSWQALFRAARKIECDMLSLIGHGLGAFSDDVATNELYFSTLLAALSETSGSLFRVFYNPGAGAKSLRQFEAKNGNIAGVYNGVELVVHDRDVLILGASMAGVARVGVSNASDADVIFGKNDFGEYWRRGHVAGEEEYAMLTTGVITGSRGTNPALYTRIY